MDTPDACYLMRNVANRRAELEEQLAHGTWHPTADTMAIILRHTLGILQAVQVAVITDVSALSSEFEENIHGSGSNEVATGSVDQ